MATDSENAEWGKAFAPGGDEAVRQGCTCPRMDNCHGEGMTIDGTRQWWIAQDCPVHGWKEKDDGQPVLE